jgi:hypothetical protein
MKKLVLILAISFLIGIGCILIGFFYQNNIVFHGFTIVGICVLLGVAVKTMDQLIDEIKIKSYRLWILPLALFIPSSMAYLALTEGPVIGMVIGTVIGLIITRKIDHLAYIASIVLFIILVFFASLLHMTNIEITTFYIIPVAAVGSFLDEFGHEHWKSNKRSITFIFKHRFFLKTFAFFGVILGFAQPIHFIGFLCFDIFYDLVDTANRYDVKSKKFVSAELPQAEFHLRG